MRFKLLLKPKENKIIIPFNHNRYIIAYLYGIFKMLQKEIKQKNETGLLPVIMKNLKYFTFSRIMIPLRKRIGSGFLMKCNKVHFFTSLMIPENFVERILNFFKSSIFYLGHPSRSFIVDEINVINEPNFENFMKFRTLSPIKVSEKIRKSWGVKYLLPGDNSLKKRIRENIVARYKKIFGHEPEDKTFEFDIDKEYLESIGGVEKITRLITIKNWRNKELKIKAFDAHFTLRGNPELIKLAYITGIGESNHLGFGMIQQI
ncbi:MAG: CRISPR-associated endoribonuclease Cas6 [Candidatus Marinimicrobia bacterium]|nr:CRISPR-associated endoribonuclease Cas6 [Candidatus Neomarinimicrobiota bacterium]